MTQLKMVMIATLAYVSSLAHGQTAITYYNGRTTVPTDGIHEAPSVLVHSVKNAQGETDDFITGEASIVAAGGFSKGHPVQRRAPVRSKKKPKVASTAKPKAAPPLTDNYQLIQNHGKIIAGMYELAPGTYEFSRHALRQNPDFATLLNEYQVFEFDRGANEPLDILLAIKKGVPTNQVLEQTSTGLRLKDRADFARAVVLGEEFRSQHVSTVGGDAVEQQVQGRISRVGMSLNPTDAPFADAFLDQNTGPGSSGGPVYLDEQNQWRLGGVIACYMTPVASRDGKVQTLSGIKLITIVALRAAILKPVDTAEIVTEPDDGQLDDDCRPYDARMGGGLLDNGGV